MIIMIIMLVANETLSTDTLSDCAGRGVQTVDKCKLVECSCAG